MGEILQGQETKADTLRKLRFQRNSVASAFASDPEQQKSALHSWRKRVFNNWNAHLPAPDSVGPLYNYRVSARLDCTSYDPNRKHRDAFPVHEHGGHSELWLNQSDIETWDAIDAGLIRNNISLLDVMRLQEEKNYDETIDLTEETFVDLLVFGYTARDINF